jgi:hypothetical protein
VEPRGVEPLTSSLRMGLPHPHSRENKHSSQSVASFVATQRTVAPRLRRRNGSTKGDTFQARSGPSDGVGGLDRKLAVLLLFG